MRTWFDRILTAGSIHPSLIFAVEGLLKAALAVLLFVVLRWVAVRGLRAVMRPLIARAGREGETHVTRLRTLEGLARSILTYTLLFLLAVTVLGQWGVNVAALVTGAGVAGLALSFGAQRLVRDVLTGFFLLLEDQFRVGEVVTLLGSSGLPAMNATVLEMGLRVTRLQEASGKLVTLSNGDISAVINHSRGPITAMVEVGVSPETRLDDVRAALSGMPLPDGLFTAPPALEGVAALEAERVVLRIAAPAQPGRAPEAEMALRQAVGETLRGAEIQIK